MRTMLKTMEQRTLAGEALVLVTITAASGATPRGTGARMLVDGSGRICGTIGGGAVEYRAEQLALQVLRDRCSVSRSFSLNRDDVQNLGMICGGEVAVFFHYIPAYDADTAALCREAERCFDEGLALWLLSDLNAGGALSLYTKERGFFGHICPEWLAGHLTRQPKHILMDGAEYCVEQIGSSGHVYLFGGGHVSQELEPLLSHLGFRCIVLEDRPEFARRKLFPTAEDIRLVDFTRIGDFVTLGEEDYVCILTRGHSYDTAVQAQVLPFRPCYVGVIGSRKKAAGVRKALKEEYGISDDLLDLVTTPIGLDIGGETPAEIAVSIAAQMIQVRAAR